MDVAVGWDHYAIIDYAGTIRLGTDNVWWIYMKILEVLIQKYECKMIK